MRQRNVSVLHFVIVPRIVLRAPRLDRVDVPKAGQPRCKLPCSRKLEKRRKLYDGEVQGPGEPSDGIEFCRGVKARECCQRDSSERKRPGRAELTDLQPILKLPERQLLTTKREKDTAERLRKVETRSWMDAGGSTVQERKRYIHEMEPATETCKSGEESSDPSLHLRYGPRRC
ncbi:hypothetical protein LIA77_10509 [Sarocladium implicatum]|nr:hypothetical protein LIA77_10509 [Sarocladium implicatum]